MKKQYLLGVVMLGVTHKSKKKEEADAPYDWICENCGYIAKYGSLKKEVIPT